MQPPDLDWAYYGFEHGQHVSLYSLKSLQCLADKFDLNFASNGYLHFFSDAEVSNHEFVKVIKGATRRSNPLAKRLRYESIIRNLKKEN